MEPRKSPHRWKLHIRSIRMDKIPTSPVKPDSIRRNSEFVASQTHSSFRPALSIALTLDSEKLREELARVAVLSLVEGVVNESNLLAVLPSILNKELAGPITPLNDCFFLLPVKSREEVKELYKLGSFVASRKLSILPWSAELGAARRASGDGLWVHIWNLPLHAWCWSIIAEVLRPVGELVALSQAELPDKYFISALVRRCAGVTLSL